MRHGQHNVAGAVLRRQMLGPRPQFFGSDNYWADYRVTHRSVGTSGVLAFNWKAEHGTLLAVGSRDAYALNIVSLERAPASSTVWTTWTPWRRDADAAPLRSVCEPHVLAVEANAHSNWINDIVFSHDDLDLLSASEDGSVVMYDVQRGKKRTVHEIPSAQAARSVSTAASDRDAVFIAANNVVYVWDRRTKSSGQSLVGHSARVSDVQSTEDGGTLWSTSLDGTLKCWDRRKNACLTSLGSRATPLASVCLDRTETRLLVSSERGPVFLFDLLATPALQGPALASVPAAKAFTGHSNRHYLKRARFSPCGNYIMCGSDDKRAYVWNVSSGKAHVFELPDVRLASLVDASFSHGPQQPLVGVASEEGLFVWSPAAVPVPSPPVTDSAPAPPTHVPYEIKFSVEGTPVDDDFVEVNDDEDDEEEEEELEEELGDLVREPGVCSYDKGYATTHVFVCRTCSLSSDPHTSAGMCFECRVTCHADHDTVSIGKKKNFRCDCGTDKYPNVPCLLRAGKEPNDRNVYTHNFELLYCFCNQPDNGELMILCIECLEWFHHTCLEIPNQEAITEGLDFICTSCITAHYPFLTQYRTANLASRSAAVPPPSGVLGYGVTGGRFMLPEWRESRVLRPEHARLASAAAASATQQASAPPAATNGTAAHNTPLPPAPAPVTAPPPAAPAAPLFEPRTKEELDAEARRLIQMGDREGARNLVMRAMLSNTLNLLSSSRRRTVTVQDVARAAQDMQAAPATTTIATGASLASLELEAQPPPQPQVPPPQVAASAPVHTATPPAAPNEAPPHGAKHARAEEPPPAASLSAPAAPERPAKAARPDDAQAPLASPAAAPPAPPSPAPLRTSAKGVEASPSPAPLRSSASAASAAPTPALAPAPVPAPSVPVPAAAPPQAPPAASPAALSTSSKSIESLPSALGASALPLTDSGASATAVVTVPDDMDAAPEDAAPGEALPPAPEAMDSEPEPVSQPPPPPRAAPPAAEPELVMGDAPALAEEPEVAMSDAAPIPAAAASTAASGAVSGSADAVEAIVDANEALADDMERRLAELVDNGA